MINPTEDNGDSRIDELEALIFSARDFVLPSDDLRARVVEDAVQEDRVRKFAGRVGALTLAVLVAWGCVMPLAHTLGDLRDELTAPSPAEVEEMAYGQTPTTGEADAREWRMVDVFSRMRSLRLGNPK